MTTLVPCVIIHISFHNLIVFPLKSQVYRSKHVELKGGKPSPSTHDKLKSDLQKRELPYMSTALFFTDKQVSKKGSTQTFRVTYIRIMFQVVLTVWNLIFPHK